MGYFIDPDTVGSTAEESEDQSSGFLGDTYRDVKSGLGGLVRDAVATADAATLPLRGEDAKPWVQSFDESGAFGSEKWQQELAQTYSPERRAQEAAVRADVDEEVSEAGKAWAAITSRMRNPRVGIGDVIKSSPGMAATFIPGMGGAKVAKAGALALGADAAGALKAGSWGARIGQSLGEGMQSGAEAAADVAKHNYEQGLPTSQGVLPAYAATTGAVSAVGLGGSKLEAGFISKPVRQGRKSSMLLAANPSDSMKMSILKATGRTAIEGGREAAEEGLQGVAETAIPNYYMDKPLTEGMGENVGAGMISGFGMGAGMHLLQGGRAAPQAGVQGPQAIPTQRTDTQGPVNDAAQQAQQPAQPQQPLSPDEQAQQAYAQQFEKSREQLANGFSEKLLRSDTPSDREVEAAADLAASMAHAGKGVGESVLDAALEATGKVNPHARLDGKKGIFTRITNIAKGCSTKEELIAKLHDFADRETDPEVYDVLSLTAHRLTNPDGVLEYQRGAETAVDGKKGKRERGTFTLNGEALASPTVVRNALEGKAAEPLPSETRAKEQAIPTQKPAETPKAQEKAISVQPETPKAQPAPATEAKAAQPETPNVEATKAKATPATQAKAAEPAEKSAEQDEKAAKQAEADKDYKENVLDQVPEEGIFWDELKEKVKAYNERHPDHKQPQSGNFNNPAWKGRVFGRGSEEGKKLQEYRDLGNDVIHPDKWSSDPAEATKQAVEEVKAYEKAHGKKLSRKALYKHVVSYTNRLLKEGKLTKEEIASGTRELYEKADERTADHEADMANINAQSKAERQQYGASYRTPKVDKDADELKAEGDVADAVSTDSGLHNEENHSREATFSGERGQDGPEEGKSDAEKLTQQQAATKEDAGAYGSGHDAGQQAGIGAAKVVDRSTRGSMRSLLALLFHDTAYDKLEPAQRDAIDGMFSFDDVSLTITDKGKKAIDAAKSDKQFKSKVIKYMDRLFLDGKGNLKPETGAYVAYSDDASGRVFGKDRLGRVAADLQVLCNAFDVAMAKTKTFKGIAKAMGAAIEDDESAEFNPQLRSKKNLGPDPLHPWWTRVNSAALLNNVAAVWITIPNSAKKVQEAVARIGYYESSVGFYGGLAVRGSDLLTIYEYDPKLLSEIFGPTSGKRLAAMLDAFKKEKFHLNPNALYVNGSMSEQVPEEWKGYVNADSGGTTLLGKGASGQVEDMSFNLHPFTTSAATPVVVYRFSTENEYGTELGKLGKIIDDSLHEHAGPHEAIHASDIAAGDVAAIHFDTLMANDFDATTEWARLKLFSDAVNSKANNYKDEVSLGNMTAKEAEAAFRSDIKGLASLYKINGTPEELCNLSFLFSYPDSFSTNLRKAREKLAVCMTAYFAQPKLRAIIDAQFPHMAKVIKNGAAKFRATAGRKVTTTPTGTGNHPFAIRSKHDVHRAAKSGQGSNQEDAGREASRGTQAVSGSGDRAGEAGSVVQRVEGVADNGGSAEARRNSGRSRDSEEAEALEFNPGRKVSPQTQQATKSFVDRQVSRLPRPLRVIAETLRNALTKTLFGAMMTRDLLAYAQSLNVLPKSMKAWADAYIAADTYRRGWEVAAGRAAEPFKDMTPEQKDLVNRFLAKSVEYGMWVWRNPKVFSSQAEFDEYYKKKVVKQLDPAKARQWHELSEMWHQLARFKDGQKTVEGILNFGRKTLAEETKIMQDEAKAIADQNLAMATTESEKTAIKQELAATMRSIAKRERRWGNEPYVPFRRFGSHVVVFRSKALEDTLAEMEKAHAAGNTDKVNELRKKVESMMSNGQDYIVEFAQSAGEAKVRAEELGADASLPEGTTQHFSRDVNNRSGMPSYAQFQKAALFAREEARVENFANPDDVKAARAVQRMFNLMYLKSLSDNSAHKRELHRRKVAGYNTNMVENFLVSAKSTANMLSNMKYGSASREALALMDKEERASGSKRQLASDLHNEIMLRHQMIMEGKDSGKAVNATLRTTSFMMLLTNPAYYMQNLLQPLMMTAPQIAGDFGASSYGRIMSQMGQVMQWVKEDPSLYNLGKLVNSDKLTGEEKEMIKALRDRGLVDVGLTQEFGSVPGTGTGLLARAAKFSEKVVGLSRKVEIVNRVASALVAYRMAREHGMTDEQATAYAEHVLYRTHGDYSAGNAPRFFRMNGVTRMATQFKKFQLIQLGQLVSLYHHAFKGADPAERLAAKRALAWQVGTYFAMSGLLGTPFASAVLGALCMLGGGDDGEEPEDMLRRWIGDKELADFLLHGVPKTLGVDLTNKVGAGGVISLNEFRRFHLQDLKSKTTAENMGNIATDVFGAPAGLMRTWLDAASTASKGRYYDALALAAPNGALRGLLQAYQGMTEGVKSKSGQTVISKEEYDVLDLIGQLAGLPTNKLTDRSYRSMREYRIEQAYTNEFADIRRAYVEARRSNDKAAAQAAIREWQEANKRWVAKGVKPNPLQSLFAAAKRSTKEQRDLMDGVKVGQKFRRMYRQQSEW